MHAAHSVLPRKIGQRARDAQHPVIAARGELQLIGGAGEKIAARLVGTRDLFEQFAVRFGIGA